jgi:RNA polymerase sigma-70 factor, ECF subfamily
VDAESREWLRQLDASAADRDTGVQRLHQLLLRVARSEVHRRQTPIGGTELDDIAQQAATDATMAILNKLPTFRGESRFTTWAYKFAMLEVSNKVGRHYWRDPPITLGREDWDRLPADSGIDPSRHAEAAELAAAVRVAVETKLTARQREVFVDIVLRDMPLDALAHKLGITRNAVYKTVWDARRKIRDFLIANHHLTEHVELDAR